MMIILLLNRYGHKPTIVSKFLVIVFRCSWVLVSLFHFRNFCLVLFHHVFGLWIRLEDPTMCLFFPSVRVVGFCSLCLLLLSHIPFSLARRWFVLWRGSLHSVCRVQVVQSFWRQVRQTDCGVIWFEFVSCPLRVMGTFSIHFLVRCQEIVELFGHFKAFGMPCVISIVYKVCRCYSEFMQVQHCLESIGTCIICFFFPCLCRTFRLLLLLLCSSSAPVQCLHHIRLWW